MNFTPYFRFTTTHDKFHFLASDGSRMPDYQLKDVDVSVGANGGYKVVHIPIVPLKVGPLEVAASVVRSVKFRWEIGKHKNLGHICNLAMVYPGIQYIPCGAGFCQILN